MEPRNCHEVDEWHRETPMPNFGSAPWRFTITSQWGSRQQKGSFALNKGELTRTRGRHLHFTFTVPRAHNRDLSCPLEPGGGKASGEKRRNAVLPLPSREIKQGKK
ncbi:hypothetical protein MRX96_007534 [Rhipicephalus microplus]